MTVRMSPLLNNIQNIVFIKETHTCFLALEFYNSKAIALLRFFAH